MPQLLPRMVSCTFCLAIAVSGPGFAAETPEGPNSTAPASSGSTMERLKELAAACAHLEAAGALDLARQAREEANRLLQQESARIAREQAALSKVADALVPPQFVIQALLIEAPELPLGRLACTVRELGGRQLPHDVNETAEVAFAARLIGETADAGLIRALAASGVDVNILSRPQVRALEDSQAQIQVGEARPIVDGLTVRDDGTAAPQIAEAMTGITLAVTPRRTVDGQTALETQLERSWFEETETILYVDPASGAATTSPVKSSFAVRTDLHSNPGEVLLLAVRPDQRRSAAPAARATLIILLHPRQLPQ